MLFPSPLTYALAHSGVVYIIFTDAERACYGAANPLYSVRQHAQSAMRAAIGEMELDEILHNRAAINSLVKGTVQEAATAWGINIKRYEITEITPDRMISQAMDKQAAAERNRREKVLEAEGEKTAARLQSEGVKIKLTNEVRRRARAQESGGDQVILSSWAGTVCYAQPRLTAFF